MKAEGDRREVYNDITYHPIGSKRIDKFNEKHGLVDRRSGGDRRVNHKLREVIKRSAEVISYEKAEELRRQGNTTGMFNVMFGKENND